MPTITVPQIVGILMLIVLIVGPICLLIKTSGLAHGLQLLGVMFVISTVVAIVTTLAFNLIGLK